jgi:hypothetical protein
MNVLTTFTQYIFVWVIFLTLFKSVSVRLPEKCMQSSHL